MDENIMTNPEEQTDQELQEKEAKSSLGILLEAAGGDQQSSGVVEESAVQQDKAIANSTEIHLSVPTNTLAQNSKDSKKCSVPKRENSATLDLLASAASESRKSGSEGDATRDDDGNDSDSRVKPECQSKEETDSVPDSSNIDTEANSEEKKARDAAHPKKKTRESRRIKAAMIKTVKSLSKDPLVQLSMLRAMEQQNVPPDQVEKNRIEREKAIEKEKTNLKQKTAKAKKAVNISEDEGPSSRDELATKVTRTKESASKESNSPRIHTTSKPQTQEKITNPQYRSLQPQILPPGSQEVQQAQKNPVVLSALQSLLKQKQHQQSQNVDPQQKLHQQQEQKPQSQHQAMNGNNQLQPNAQNLGQSQNRQNDNQFLAGALALLQSALGNLQTNNASNMSFPQGSNPTQMSHQPLTGTPMMLNQAGSSNMQPVGNLSLQSIASPSLEQGVAVAGLSGADVGADGVYNGEKQSHLKVGSPMAIAGGKDDAVETRFDVRIPCRARGMPPDHNLQTAHFVVPKDVVHGQDLVCSYPACRDSGVKFRYCAHCRIPVAKRNFRLRHNHLNGSVPDAEESEVPSTICVAPSSALSSHLPEHISPASAGPQIESLQEGEDTILPVPERKRKEDDRERRERKKKRHRSSKHKEKKEKRKRPRTSEVEYNADGAIPLTIRISSDRAAPSKSVSAEAQGGMADATGDNGPNQKVSEKASKHSSRSKTSSSKRERKRSKRSPSKKRKHSRKSEKGASVDRESLKQMRGPTSYSVSSEANEKSKVSGITKSDTSGPCLVGDAASDMVTVQELASRNEKLQKFSNKRILVWANLLGERPSHQDDENMSKWLMNVLAVSDPKAPLKESFSLSPSSLSDEA